MSERRQKFIDLAQGIYEITAGNFDENGTFVPSMFQMHIYCDGESPEPKTGKTDDETFGTYEDYISHETHLRIKYPWQDDYKFTQIRVSSIPVNMVSVFRLGRPTPSGFYNAYLTIRSVKVDKVDLELQFQIVPYQAYGVWTLLYEWMTHKPKKQEELKNILEEYGYTLQKNYQKMIRIPLQYNSQVKKILEKEGLVNGKKENIELAKGNYKIELGYYKEGNQFEVVKSLDIPCDGEHVEPRADNFNTYATEELRGVTFIRIHYPWEDVEPFTEIDVYELEYGHITRKPLGTTSFLGYGNAYIEIKTTFLVEEHAKKFGFKLIPYEALGPLQMFTGAEDQERVKNILENNGFTFD